MLTAEGGRCGYQDDNRRNEEIEDAKRSTLAP